MELLIYAHDRLFPANDLQLALAKELAGHSEIALTIRKAGLEFRSIEPAILVASVTAAGAAIGTVVGGLLRIAQENKSQKIVLQGSKGQRLEVPANTPPEKIDLLMERVRQMDTGPLKISLE